MRRVGLVAVLAAAAAAGVAVWVVSAEPEWYQRVRYPLRYEAIVVAHARNYDLPPTLLAAVIYTESKFDADARSGAGAVGLMQLLPETAKGIALRTGGDRFVVSDLVDPNAFTVVAHNTKTRQLLAKASCKATSKGEIVSFRSLPVLMTEGSSAAALPS